MKKSNDTIGNRTRDLPTCSIVPQPTALPRAPHVKLYQIQKPFLYFGATKKAYNKGSDENGYIYLGLWV